MRRQAEIIIERDGRDKGGRFLIEEMPVVGPAANGGPNATDWFLRAMQILGRSEMDISPEIASLGIIAIAAVNASKILNSLAKTPFMFEVKPLLDELMTCVKSYLPPGGAVPVTNPQLIRGQIEEVSTILQLHEEIISLHLGFSLAAETSNFLTLAAMRMSEITPDTETSTNPLEMSSAEDERVF